MIVHWPAGIADDQRGSLRRQFVNVSDIAPTIYDLLGITPPEVFKGLDQLPITGCSFASVLADPDAPPANTVQYFEMTGSRALVANQNGRVWKAVCRHIAGADYDTESWELYDLGADASECNDVAASHADKLEELIALWWVEADRHGVLPLDDRLIELFRPRFRDRSPHPPHRRYAYRPPMSPIPAQAGAPIAGRSFDLTAHVSRAVGDEGVLWSIGTENSGISVFIQNDRLVVDYNAFDDHTVVESDIEVPATESTLTARFRRGEGTVGWIEVAVDGVDCGRGETALFMRMISSVGSSVGYDHGSAVSPRYRHHSRSPAPCTRS